MDTLKSTLIIAVITLATIVFGILIRHELAFGGEMIIPPLAIAYLAIREDLWSR